MCPEIHVPYFNTWKTFYVFNILKLYECYFKRVFYLLLKSIYIIFILFLQLSTFKNLFAQYFLNLSFKNHYKKNIFTTLSHSLEIVVTISLLFYVNNLS